MLDAPQQNWPLYESMTRQADAAWIRSLTPADRFVLYADLFDLVGEARQKLPSGDRLEDRHWRRKIELRQRMINAYAMRDQRRRERAASKHAD